MTSKATRILTGVAGLPVSKNPQKELLNYYGKILRGLKEMPQESKYRTTTEQLIKERKGIVESTEDPRDIEKKIGGGLCEEMIEQAKHELTLVQTMIDYKPWEPLEERPPQNQWKWPL